MISVYPSLGFYAALGLWWFGLLAGSAGLGRWCLRRAGLVAGRPAAERLLGLGVGLVVLSFVVFAGAVLHLLSTAFLFGVFGAWTLVGYLHFKLPPVAQPVAESLPIRSPFFFALICLLAGTALFNLIPVLVPAVDWDGLAYHLALPKIYLAAGGFVFRPDIFHNLFPQLTEMLYLAGSIFPYGIAAKLIHFSFGLLAAGAVYAAGRESGLRQGALLGAAIFYLQYVVQIESGTAFIDLATAAYAGLAMVAGVYAWRHKAAYRWLYLMMFFAGATAATKWHGLMILGLAAAWVVMQVVSEGDLSAGDKVRRLGWVGFWGALPVGPYFIRAWILGGDPIWPLGYRIFGGRD
jgi:hypothetical protein